VRGLRFGLPAVYNPDELAIMSRALAFGSGDLNPHNFLYPTFYFYALFAWVGAAFVALRAGGFVESLGAFQQSFFIDPTAIYLAGRSLSVVAGAATVWLLARRLRGADSPGAAWAAGLFLAVSPIAVRDAHYVKHDVFATLWVVVAMLAMWRMIDHDRADPSRLWQHAGAAGAACGIAFSTHYYTVFLVLPLVLAIVFATEGTSWRLRVRATVAAGIGALVVFLALSPFILVEPATAWRDIVANRHIVVDRAAAVGGTDRLPSAAAYARMLWHEAVGWPVLAMAVAGIPVLFGRSWRLAVWWLAFPCAFLLFISNTVAATRYLNPVLPFLAMLAATAVDALIGRVWGLRQSPSSRLRPVATLAAAAALALPGIGLSVDTGTFFRNTDTRTLGQHFIEARLPPGASVLVQPYGVQLHQSRESLIEALSATLGDPTTASRKFQMRLRLDPYPSPAYRTVYLGDGGLDVDKVYVRYAEIQGPDPLAALRRHRIEYVVWKRYDPPEAAARAFVTALDAQARLLARFTPYRPEADAATRRRVVPFLHNTDTPLDPALGRPGPIIEIWAILGGNASGPSY
jgi:hypothetical protein